MFNRRKFLKLGVAAGASLLLAKQAQAQTSMPDSGINGPDRPTPMKRITIADRKAASARMRKQGFVPGMPSLKIPAASQGGQPDYFGIANWANSPLPYGSVALGQATIDAPGIGYAPPPDTYAVITDAVGPGTGATATVTVNGLGEITGVNVTSGGTGYRAPVVTIIDNTGIGIDAAVSVTLDLTTIQGGIRKFVDTIEGIGPAGMNTLGNYIPVATPDTITYPDADYYEIELVEFDHQFHRDLPVTTKLRGYRQTNMGTSNGVNNVSPEPVARYLGPTIVARRDRPVRVKFTNNLPTGAGGDLYIPVDTTVMGVELGPTVTFNGETKRHTYSQNRATIHNHGARTPWNSDGTAHQWTVPAGEDTAYKRGASVYNVADMDEPGDGSLTFFYTNQQSARLLFYHDHAWGITRLNVYVGEAAGYLIVDDVEADLVNGTNLTGVNPGELNVLPADIFPLIFQDKGFVDVDTVLKTDPTWMWGTGLQHDIIDSVTGQTRTVREPVHGDLWYPHVYVPAQNPGDVTGVNPWGRWAYGPWFWPPTTNVLHQPIPDGNPYAGPEAPWEPTVYPGLPDLSICGETFMDTALVNGVAYPTVTVQPRAYRFRILNACNDRFVNLHLYKADPNVVTPDGRINTEVRMVPAYPQAGFPATWPSDGRVGGVPDWTMRGPEWIVLGSEGGFLPMPVLLKHQPITWNNNPTTFNFGNVDQHCLLLAPAERADVIVDFSGFAGQTLIVYNDAPAAFPALDPRYDYYTGAPDLSGEGGAPTILPGYGPNIRTFMQIVVDNTVAPEPAYDFALLQSVWRGIPANIVANTPAKPGVFQADQDEIIAPYNAYNLAYAKSFPADAFARIYSQSLKFVTVKGTTVTKNLLPKGIHDEMGAAFDIEYGRMQSKLGVELPNPSALTQNFILYEFIDPVTESFQATLQATPISNFSDDPNDGTQFWKITHNGVDTHPVHFHLFDVQLVNRVGWDGTIRKPHATELGWKDTLRISPLEDTIVAFRPILPRIPYGVPNSIRPLDPSRDLGTTAQFSNLDPLTGQAITPPVSNVMANFGWEYTWHCHILSHEEMDMMRATVMNVNTALPTAPVLTFIRTGVNGNTINFTWTDATPWTDGGPSELSTLGNPQNEIGFRLQRAPRMVNGLPGDYTTIQSIRANKTTASFTRDDADPRYFYRVVAYNNSGNSFSNAVMIGQYIAAPSNVAVTVFSGPTGSNIRVNFRDNATNETGFVIERQINSGAFVQVGTQSARTGTGVSTPAFFDTSAGFQPGATIVYRVKAINAISESDYGVAAAVVLPLAPAAPSMNTPTTQLTGTTASVSLSWIDNANNEQGFQIQRSTNPTFASGVTSINVTTADTTTYSDNNRPRNTLYYYRVRAYNAGGVSSWSNTVSIRTAA